MKYLWIVLVAVSALAQKPVAELPRINIDTTYSLPVGGTTRAAHNAAQLTTALSAAVPGDVIVLDAGVTYTGNWQLPLKANPSNKWIYITTSAYSSLPAPGVRVAPSDAANMPKLVSPGNTPMIMMNNGANYFRFVGIEMYPNSNYPAGCPGTRNCTMANFIGGIYPPNPLPDHIFVDRCYMHGTDTQDIQGGFLMNGSNMAMVDSYMENVHYLATDSWGVGANISPGPIKIVNNFIEASSENIIFGGGGGGYGGYLTSDITITGNYLFKRLSWVPLSCLSGTPLCPSPVNKLVVKNAFEVKEGQRILFDSNIVENVWAGGQLGNALALSVRTGQSGDFAVSNDITVTNNEWKNILWFANGTALDDLCGTSSYPHCTNPGSQARWNISNNVITYYDPTAQGTGVGGGRNYAAAWQPSLNHFTGQPGQVHDVIFQHNTFVANANGSCYAGIYFGTGNLSSPGPNPLTSNMWIIDNEFCRQPYGQWGYTPTWLNQYMGYPSTPPYDITARFTGNVMLKQSDPTYTWLGSNNVTTTVTYDVHNQLVTPDWSAHTTDGHQAGYAYGGLIDPLAYNSPVSLPSVVQGTAYTPITVTATGGVTPYTFSLVSPDVWPTGMTMTTTSPTTAQIAGTPTVSGTFPINIKVTDNVAATDTSGNMNLVVTPSGSTLAYVSPLTMPDGIYGTAYTTTNIVATGGTAPYTCTVQTGSLPPGITQSGCVVSGTPTAVGVYPGIVFRVTDSATPTPAFVDSLPLQIVINPSAPTLGVEISGNLQIGPGVSVK